MSNACFPLAETLLPVARDLAAPADALEGASMRKTSLTLMLLLDAFRPDYLRHTPFIRELAGQSATGCLRECFGFLPRAAYFGGLDAGKFGFTNMYCFDPENSIFSSARMVAAGEPRPASELENQMRRFVEEKARLRLPAFAKAYASSAQIPLPYLPYFDLVEKRAPWDKQAGFTSLFALLNQSGIPWCQCSWPDSNRLADHSDAGIVRHVLQTLRPEHRFAYVHLGELDGIGHLHGPNSRPLLAQLARTDNLCQQLVETARRDHDALNVILFGDHGMVNVTRTLDLGPHISSAKLRFGSDFAYFLDSTMARFWFFHRGAEAAIRAALRDVSGGRILEPAELEQFGIAGCDRRNGEMYFLADPGVLLFPNFFQAQGEPIKGMHGYDPDCADNLGIFVLHCADRPDLAGWQLGRVNPPQIFPLLEHLIGLPGAAGHRISATRPPECRSRFTANPEPGADAAVQRHLDAIIAAVRGKVGAFQAMVLTGSFGRGEGGVFRDDTGEWRPVNDYDIFVVSQQDCSRELRELSQTLPQKLGLDYLDLGWTDGNWAHWPLTVANYDLKYGSQVVTGDPRILDSLPAFASAELPVYEGVKLLLNRTAGLLTGLRGEMLAGIPLKANEHRYLCNQIAKAQMALGDSYLIQWGGYDASYRHRGERFQALAGGAGLPAAAIRQVAQGYRFKLNPDYTIHADPLAAVSELRPFLAAAIMETVSRFAGRRAASLAEAMDLYLAAMSQDPGWVRADNTHILGRSDYSELLHTPGAPSFSLRFLACAVLPELLAAAFDPAGADLSAAVRRLESAHFKLSVSPPADLAAWEKLRALAVKAWSITNH